ncbi:type II secretion system protein G [Nitrosospira lacus]|uniref:Type II secretion system protein G n=1 Tax=Nitrosospira lacus TaxID=1288494 RepID=A0A1W6SMR1_9PROT|nr:type II secretion system protein G [Nitrosospira lacus]
MVMNRRTFSGFTLIELLVVLAILMLLLTVAVPRYFSGVDRAKEAALKQNLSVMREAVDKFYGDQARYPYTLEELAERKYIRSIPVDPVTESAKTWIIVPPSDDTPGSVYDLHSGATTLAMDGSSYGDW